MTGVASSRVASTRWLITGIAALFFLSGFSALIYQVLWLRLLSLVFGVTVHAATTVVAAFMTGLALGSIWAGRLAHRLRRPLAGFALVEALVAATALGSLPVLNLVEQVFVALAGGLPESAVFLTLARFVLSFAVLLVPALLMGATLPLVMQSSLAGRMAFAQSVGVLYGANTAGAVAGALIAGFHLVGQVGIWRSFVIAAAVNVATALGALALDRRWRDAPSQANESVVRESPASVPDVPLTAGASRTVLGAFILSGFASLALEVVWFRILILHLGATAYAFVSMLSTFLAGIAIGSWAIVPLVGRARPSLAFLAALQAATAVATLCSLAFLAVASGQPWFRTTHATTLAIAPATLLMGAAFPVGLRLWASQAHDVARRIGVFYSLNVCGGIVGSITAGFFLLPRLGARASVIAAASVFVASSLMLLAHASGRRTYRLAGAAAILAAAFWSVTRLPDPIDVALRGRPRPILWREEGVQTTVSIHRQPGGTLVMYLDGLHQANDSAEMLQVHREIGTLPMALHPRPEHALVIGLGGGATAGAVSRHANVAVDVVELSQAVVRGARWFRHVNYDVVAAPNVRMRVDDGRNYLLLSGRKYDVITADIIQPMHAGAGSLYSAEYFRLGRAALDDDGLMLQWIGRRETTQYKLIMRTFLSVFPDATLWSNGTLMVGSLKPLQVSLAAFERKLKDHQTRAALEEVGLGSVDALLGRYTAGPDEMRALVGSGEILTDDRPMVEYFRTLPGDDPPIDLTGVAGDVRRHVAPDSER
jgi:spermidine synthase